MAYLTNFSFQQLIETTEIKNIDKIGLQFFTKNIYDNLYLYYFFNKLELNKLLRAKTLLSGDSMFVITYNTVETRIDDYNYILPVKGQVKYHMSLECEALNRGFKNFFMPPAIIKLKTTDPEKHQNIVTEIRNWFIQNNYTVERYEDQKINSLEITKNFNSYFPSKYKIEKIIISEKPENDFQWYISKKTDNIKLSAKFNYDTFLYRVSVLIKNRHSLCDTSAKDNLSRYDYLINKSDHEIIEIITQQIDFGSLQGVSHTHINSLTLPNLKKFWLKHIDLKKEAMRELNNYFKWTYNFEEKKFDTIYLENFNLAQCRICKDK